MKICHPWQLPKDEEVIEDEIVALKVPLLDILKVLLKKKTIFFKKI